MRHTKILSLLLCLALVLTLLPGMSAYADGVAYRYLDASGASQTCNSANVVTESTTAWGSGWYVANPGTTNIGSRITVSGDVHLILADHATLNANAGITVEGDNSLTIYAQSTGGNMGTLNATGAQETYSAGIGAYNPEMTWPEPVGGNITINGGKIKATGASGEYGGGAGIGGCYMGLGAEVTINGGVVTANGGKGAAGIGSGSEYYHDEFKNVTINGGTVIANGGEALISEEDPDYSIFGGAGIGGGFGGHGINVTFNDGFVTATGGPAAAGIGDGAGYDGDRAATLNFNGGIVTASGGNAYAGTPYKRGAGIGGGYAPSRGTNVDAMYNRGALNFGEGVKVYADTYPNPTTERSLTGSMFFAGFARDHMQQYVRVEGPVSSPSSDTPVESVTLDKTDAQTVTVGGNVAFTATVFPDDATVKTVKWSVGGTNESAVKLYSDANCSTEVGTDATATLIVYAKGISAGSATVTVTSNADDTKTASCAVTVKEPVTGVSLNPSTLDLTTDGVKALTATVEPSNATDKTVKWSVSGTNENAVKLYSDSNCSTEVGTDATKTLTVFAKGISAGSATVTVTSNADDSKTASCAVTVTPVTISSVAVTGIEAPAAGQNLDTTAESETANVTLSAVAFEPESEDGKASYATVYKAAVTATAAENYAFTDDTTATVNGNTATAARNEDGTLTISYTFEKTVLNPVVIETSNVEMPYSPNGIDIPVNGMFDIPDGAGTATYFVSNRTGEGTYNAETGKLVVTKCGTFNVSVNTAATDTHSYGIGTAILTINKAKFTPVVTLEGWTMGETSKTPSVTGNLGGGDVTYSYKLKDADDSAYTDTIPGTAGEYTVKADIAETAFYNAASATADFTIAKPTFGPADFTLPASTRTIGDNAFEGAAMKSVDARFCTAIGAGAFKNCQGLQQICLPDNCAIDDSAFEGCGTVYVFAYSGGTTETWCRDKDDIVFVSRGESN